MRDEGRGGLDDTAPPLPPKEEGNEPENSATRPGALFGAGERTGLRRSCEIEYWKHTYVGVMEALQIDGVATCDKGEVRLRFYGGEGDARKFIGVETAHIEGHISQAIKLQIAKPKALSIEYSVDPG